MTAPANSGWAATNCSPMEKGKAGSRWKTIPLRWWTRSRRPSTRGKDSLLDIELATAAEDDYASKSAKKGFNILPCGSVALTHFENSIQRWP